MDWPHCHFRSVHTSVQEPLLCSHIQLIVHKEHESIFTSCTSATMSFQEPCFALTCGWHSWVCKGYVAIFMSLYTMIGTCLGHAGKACTADFFCTTTLHSGFIVAAGCQASFEGERYHVIGSSAAVRSKRAHMRTLSIRSMR